MLSPAFTKRRLSVEMHFDLPSPSLLFLEDILPPIATFVNSFFQKNLNFSYFNYA